MELRRQLSGERQRIEELRRHIARLEIELSAWRCRAESAEAELAWWWAWRRRPAWDLFVKLVAARQRLAPPGSVRDLAVRGTVRTLQRLLRATTALASPPKSAPLTKAVLYISGRPGATRRYRCDHHAEQLRLLGAAVQVADLAETNLGEVLPFYRYFILHRVPFDSDVGRFLEHARNRGACVVFDTDDLIFDTPGDAVLPESVHRDDALARHRTTLSLVDAVTVSTEPLAEVARHFHARVLVIPNVVSIEMLKLAEAAHQRTPMREHQDGVTIAYFSGTASHDRDFLEAADAVIWALERYPFVRLLAVGPVTLDSRFDAFSDRIERLSVVPWEALPEVMAGVDLNLAPFERGNRFSECKSCIKYLEAALLRVPTVASPRSDFVRAIEHGRNGFLAETSQEWCDALRRLVESAELRRELGAAAYEDVRRNHTAAVCAKQARKDLQSILGGGAGVRPLRVNWVAGKARPLLELAGSLAEAGHAVSVHVGVEAAADAPELAPADVSIATDPASARVVASNPHSLFRCYLPPDEEWADLDELPLLPIFSDRAAALEFGLRTGRPSESLEIPPQGCPDAVSWSECARRLEAILREVCFVRLAD